MNPTSAMIFAVDGNGTDTFVATNGSLGGDDAVYGLTDVDPARLLDGGDDSSLGLISAIAHAPPLEQRLDSHFFADHCNAVPLLGQAWDAAAVMRNPSRDDSMISGSRSGRSR
jgi:hypothetical protein